jgi:hypothetical protein
MDPVEPTLNAPGTKRLKPKYDEPLSHFAFNFKLRRYNLELVLTAPRLDTMWDMLQRDPYAGPEVGLCRLTVSKPALKAPMVSAISA